MSDDMLSDDAVTGHQAGEPPPNAEGAEGAERTARPRVPAEVLRRAREAMGLQPPEVARALRIGRSSYYRFESEGGDAPPWLLLALGGLGVTTYGRSVTSMMTLFGIDPDVDPARTPQGTYAPFIPTLDQINTGMGRQPRRTRATPPGDQTTDGEGQT